MHDRRIGFATAVSVLTGLAGQATLMISGPLVARMLGADGRGQLAALVLWPSVIAQLGGLGMPLAVTYELAHGSAGVARAKRAVLLFAGPQAVILSSVHALVLLFILSGEPASMRAAGLATLVAVPASLAQQYGLAMLQGKQRFAAFNALRLLPATVYAGGVVALFVVGVDSVLSVVLVTMGANLAIGVTTLTTGLRVAGRADAAAQRGDISAMLRFGLRGLLGSVLPIESLPLDQMVLALFLAKDALGLYVVGLAFTNLPRFVSQSVGLVAYPAIAGQTDATAARRSLWAFFWLTMAMAVVIVVPLWLAAGRLVPFFFGGDFRDAVSVTRILLPGALFAAGRRILSDGMRGRGHAAAGTVAEVASWFWLAPALAILVPLWGVNGVAAALSGSYAVSLAALLILAVAQGEVPYGTILVATAARRARLPGALRVGTAACAQAARQVPSQHPGGAIPPPPGREVS
jgi:O-antigen/teichoic acid export membrane protein